MTSSEIVFYEFAGADPELRISPHCWKTRMALVHKGLQAVRVPWRLVEKDRIAFSGQERVPVLVHRGESVSDSWRIALHLEEQFSEKPTLFGAPAAIPLARFVNGWADGALAPALLKIILLDIYNCLHEKDRSYFRSSREKRFGMSLEAVVADQSAGLAVLRTTLEPLRQVLTVQNFISGSAPAYADYCVFGMFMWARCASRVELLKPDDPVFSWRARLLDAFDGYARSAPSVQ